jgi:hypothetical protein
MREDSEIATIGWMYHVRYLATLALGSSNLDQPFSKRIQQLGSTLSVCHFGAKMKLSGRHFGAKTKVAILAPNWRLERVDLSCWILFEKG